LPVLERLGEAGSVVRGIKARWAVLALSVGAAGGILGAGTASAGHNNGGADSVRGSAVNEFPTPVGPGAAGLTAAVASGPAGEHPRGFVEATGNADGTAATGFFVRGEATCVRVSGRRAAIKYRFRRAQGTAEPFKGGGVQIFIEDNGQAGDGQPVDATANDPPQTAEVFDTNAAHCDDPDTRTYDEVESGDYVVRDR
jgi:hypothetical protein